MSTVLEGLVAVSDIYDSADGIEPTYTLYAIGIDTQEKISDLANWLQIPPEVWVAFKNERSITQIDDDWFWWFSADPDLETFIYMMTVY